MVIDQRLYEKTLKAVGYALRPPKYLAGHENKIYYPNFVCPGLILSRLM